MEIECHQARPEDAPQIVLLLKQMHEEMPLLPTDDARIILKISEFISRGDVIAVTHGDLVVGSVGLDRVEWWSAPMLRLVSRWVYVAKRWRRSKAGHLLLKAARRHAQDQGMPLEFDVVAFDQVDRKNRLYRRYFKPVGEKFLSGLEYMKD